MQFRTFDFTLRKRRLDVIDKIGYEEFLKFARSINTVDLPSLSIEVVPQKFVKSYTYKVTTAPQGRLKIEHLQIQPDQNKAFLYGIDQRFQAGERVRADLVHTDDALENDQVNGEDEELTAELKAQAAANGEKFEKKDLTKYTYKYKYLTNDDLVTFTQISDIDAFHKDKAKVARYGKWSTEISYLENTSARSE